MFMIFVGHVPHAYDALKQRSVDIRDLSAFNPGGQITYFAHQNDQSAEFVRQALEFFNVPFKSKRIPADSQFPALNWQYWIHHKTPSEVAEIAKTPDVTSFSRAIFRLEINDESLTFKLAVLHELLQDVPGDISGSYKGYQLDIVEWLIRDVAYTIAWKLILAASSDSEQRKNQMISSCCRIFCTVEAVTMFEEAVNLRLMTMTYKSSSEALMAEIKQRVIELASAQLDTSLR